MAADWIRREVATGFQKLWLLRLKDTPAADLIDGTVMAWCEFITRNNVYDERRDVPRFQAAFAALGANLREWPAPADFLEAFPELPKEPYLLRIEDESVREKNLRFLEDFAATMRWSPPKPKRYSVPTLQPDDFPRCCEKGTREKPVCDDCRAEMAELHGPVRKVRREGAA